MRPILLASLTLLLLFNCDRTEAPLNENTGERTTANSASDELQLFELLEASVTGIDFVNNVTETHEVNMINLAYIYNGGGVAILDYDQDGWQDVFMVSNQENNKLYRNQGDFTFKDVTETVGLTHVGGFCTGVAVADVNADGFPDLLVSRGGIDNSPAGQQKRTNLAYVSQGDGTFQEMGAEIGLNSNRFTTQQYFFDYDADGDLDCYVLNTPSDFTTTTNVRVKAAANGGYERILGPAEPWESDQLLRNDGGRFTDVSKAAGIDNRGFGLSVSIYDFNADGRPDIFVGNDYIEPDYVYINQGNGTFRDQAGLYFRHTASNTMGSDIQDINNDGLLDVVSLDMLAEDEVRRKELETSMRTDRYQSMVQLGFGHQMMSNVLQLNNGDGSFSEIGNLAGISATDWSWAPLLADFDNDRHNDLFVTNGYRYDITNIDYVAYTVDSINRLGGISRKTFPVYDQFLQLVPTQKIANYCFRNGGDLRFDNVTTDWGVDQPAYSSGVAYADLDNDGDLDLVVNNLHENAFVYRNRAETQTREHHFLRVKAKGPAGNPAGIGLRVTARVGNDVLEKELYVVRGFLSSVEAVLHFGLGEAAVIDELIFTWPDGKTQRQTKVAADQVLVADHSRASTGGYASRPALPPSAYKDLFAVSNDRLGLNFQHRENNFYDFNREFLLHRMLSREGPALATADVNGDDLTDVFFGGAAGQPGALFLQSASGNFLPATWNQHPEREDVDATFFDADGDGDQDLYVVSGGYAFAANDARYQDRLYLNDGRGGFTYAADRLPAVAACGAKVLAVDLDQDGDQDLLVGSRAVPGAYPATPASQVLRNEGNGRFSATTNELLEGFTRIGMVTDLAAADLDLDGRDEIVVVGEWMPVTVFNNEQGIYRTGNDKFTFPASRGWWKSVEVADLDGDDRPDLVLGNEGWNNRFRPTPSAPLELYAADFDGNGSMDPILTVNQNGRVAPLANRAKLLKQLPGLKKKFVKNRDYAMADITEALGGKAALVKAQKLEAHTLSSTIFYNDTDGFAAVDLPSAAQLSPLQSVVITDLNEDGRPDLVGVGNDYGLEVESGRYDASNGCVLINEGRGNWTSVAGNQSGFRAALDGRDLQLLDTGQGGSRSLVIANNNGPALLYRLK